MVMAGVLKVRVQSQRRDVARPIGPILFPICGSRLHASVVVCFVRKTEITLILISKDGVNCPRGLVRKGEFCVEQG